MGNKRYKFVKPLMSKLSNLDRISFDKPKNYSDVRYHPSFTNKFRSIDKEQIINPITIKNFEIKANTVCYIQEKGLFTFE